MILYKLRTGFVKKLIWIPYCLKVVEASVANSKCSITGQQGMLDVKPDGLGAVSLSTGTLFAEIFSRVLEHTMIILGIIQRQPSKGLYFTDL
ncbi:hypothetical protein WN943_004893 [Citrus x changshan-huyou]